MSMKTQGIPTPRSVLSLLFVLAGATAALAQETDRADPKDSRVQTLNPFVVTSDGNIGYLAQNSLSGSRLNTSMADLAVPTTAFTKEFIEDVASTSVDELSQYMLSASIDYPEANQAFFTDDSAHVRIRGLPATSYAVDYFPTIQRLDLYAAERVDQSRGPNSILFGLGSPGGVINVTSKRARTTTAGGSVSLQTRDTGGLRSVLDYNQPIVEGKVALRLAAVKDDRNTWRENEYDHQKRVLLAGAWDIAKSTRLDVQWETGHINKSTVAPWVIADAYTPWVAAGSHLSASANSSQQVRSLGNTQYEVVDTSTGTAMNWRAKTASTLNQIEGVQVYLSDFSIMPREAAVHAGPSFPQVTDYDRLAAFLSHSFTPDFTMELAATSHKMDRQAFNGSSFAVLNVDTNPTLPSGAANPNAGRTYLEGFPVRTTTADEIKAVRFTAAYKFDLGSFGRHQFAVLLERDWTRQAILQERLYNVTTPYSYATPDNGNNLIRYRTYFDLNGPVSQMKVGAWDQYALNSLVDTATNRQIGADWINYAAGSADNNFRLDSAMGVLQSHFLKNRLVTVVGYRKDWQDAWYSPIGVRGPGTNGYTNGAYIVIPYGQDVNSVTANNLTFSGLYRVLPWLGIAYNRANNSALPSPRAALPTASGRAPMPRGRSEDIGLKVDLGHRLSLNVTYFKTSAERDYQAYQAGDARPDQYFNQIWSALDAAGVPGPNGGAALDQQILANGYTFDTAASGYEVELIANPTRDWRVFMNFSDYNVKRTNIGRENQQYFADNRAYWTQGDNGRVLLDGSGGRAPVADNGDNVIETVAEAVGAIDQEIQSDYIIPDGLRPRGSIPRKINLRTSYDFPAGPLHGWTIGGGARYESGQVVNSYVSGTSKTTVYGDSRTLFDLELRYQADIRIAARKVRWSAQLNVNNVFDETAVLPVRVATTGEIQNYRLQVPQELIFTTRLSF